jgi:rhamnosyl/mannosyltransferase
MKDLRLLHLISEKPPVKSGFSTAISRLAEELTKMGHKVDVLSAYDCHLKVVGEIKLVLDTSRIDRYIRDGDYDIVHVHGHTPLFSDRLLLKSKLSGRRSVYTLHCLADYYLKPISRLYNSILDSIVLGLADAVIVTSRSYYNMVYTSRKHLVPWGVDYDRFSGTRRPSDGYRLLFVGQMRPYKGLKVLLRAMEGLDAELRVVGEGPDRAEYEWYAQRLGLNNVRFYGAVPDDALRHIYLSSDVLVLPSLSMNEAFGLVTLEAAAAGCTVVASDLPGVRDVVGEFGLLIRPNDPLRLREALLTLRERSVRDEYVSKGMRAAARYSWRKVAEDHVKIYNNVLSGSQ